MLTISNQIKNLSPDSWYRFRLDEISVNLDLEKRYGVDEESSFIINAVNANYLKPRWNRPVSSFIKTTEDFTSNQLAESEFLIENDASFMTGRNETLMAGLNLTEHTDEIEDVDDVLQKINSNEIREYLFQFRPSSVSKSYNYLNFDYSDKADSFLPLIYDVKNPELSFTVNEHYINPFGKYEIWGGSFNPKKLDENDTREMRFRLINPTTGIAKSERKFMFMRTATLNSTNSQLLSGLYDVQDLYEQPMYEEGVNNFSLMDIIILKGGRYYKMKVNADDEDILTYIPQADKIYFVVKTPNLFHSRSYTIDEKVVSVSNNEHIMNFLGFRFEYVSGSNRTRIFDIYNNRYLSDVTTLTDTTYLFYIKTYYKKNSGFDPANGKFNYSLVLEIEVINSNTKLKSERIYSGGMSDFKYRGVTPVTSIPSFDSYPLMLGNMPFFNENVSLKKNIECVVDDVTDPITLTVIDKVIYRGPYSISAIDNITCFINKDVYSLIAKLYESQYRQDNSILDKQLIQYWPCDSLRAVDLRTSQNTKNNEITSYYDLYGYMKLSGPGKVIAVPEKNHSVIKSALYFDGNVTGNSNTMNTWSNNSALSINFWFKTDQRTKGVILCDMDKESLITAGIYIGIADGGFLEIAFDTPISKIYQTNVADNVYHMITIVVLAQSYEIYLDSVHIDSRVRAGTSNKKYTWNYQTYFMGHPRGKCTKGYISRISYYKTRLMRTNIIDIYLGDIEHRIYGTVLASNMPFATEIRFYSRRTGEYLTSAYSSEEDGKFMYRNYDGTSVDMIVVNNNHEYGTIQVLGPISPSSVEQ